jgi:hypothetical protein
MDEPGITARSFKGGKGKVVSLTSCQTKARFQDANNIPDVSAVVTVSLGPNSLPLLFLTVSDVTFKDAELCTMLRESAGSRWSVRVTCIIPVVSICIVMAIMRRASSDAQTGFAEKR